MSILIRPAVLSDLDQLVALEKSCFDTDQLSRRSFKHWITTEHRSLLVAELEQVGRIGSIPAATLLASREGGNAGNAVDLSSIKPSPEGEGWVRGNQNKEESLFNPPHPNLLPQGEGARTLKSTVLGNAEDCREQSRPPSSAVVGYVLVIYHPGTRLARVYSLAVAPSQRGAGIAKSLMLAAEQAANDAGRLYLRLEVSVDNISAIKLYETLGYQKFGIYRDYYEDHKDALRYQKLIRRYHGDFQHRSVHWLRQTTPFTCGPASLMMAMHGLNRAYQPSQQEELSLWREATTIFMTSGPGGCHPIGLALAAKRRRFEVEVWVNQAGALFIDSVRSEEKKRVIELADNCFKLEAQQQNIKIHYANIGQSDLINAFKAGAIPLILISTFQMDRKKVPHWVVMSGFDDDCLYVHDPDPEEIRQSELDCQFIPIAFEDFGRMSSFGKSRLRTAVIIWPGQDAIRRTEREA